MTMRQRLAHIALGGVLVLSGVIASSFLQTADLQQSHTEIVKAREFHVVNEGGATTAIIASDPHGLKIQNATGCVAVSILGTKQGGNLIIHGQYPFGTVSSRAIRLMNDNFMVAGIAASIDDNGLTIGPSTRGDSPVVRVKTHSVSPGLEICNDKGQVAAYIKAAPPTLGGGYLGVNTSNGENAVSIQGGGNGGLVRVIGTNGSTQILVDEHGGHVGVFGKGSNKAKAAMGINEYGSGAVSTWDKNGYRQR